MAGNPVTDKLPGASEPAPDRAYDKRMTRVPQPYRNRADAGRQAANPVQGVGTAVPIMQSRVTMAASRASSQPSVPAGRPGSTR